MALRGRPSALLPSTAVGMNGMNRAKSSYPKRDVGWQARPRSGSTGSRQAFLQPAVVVRMTVAARGTRSRTVCLRYQSTAPAAMWQEPATRPAGLRQAPAQRETSPRRDRPGEAETAKTAARVGGLGSSVVLAREFVLMHGRGTRPICLRSSAAALDRSVVYRYNALESSRPVGSAWTGHIFAKGKRQPPMHSY
jgi:hypothetical protein